MQCIHLILKDSAEKAEILLAILARPHAEGLAALLAIIAQLGALLLICFSCLNA